MITIATIVEGHGEVTALPVLIRRIAQDCGVTALNLPRPHRVPRDRMTDPLEMGRAVRLQAGRVTDRGAVLVLVDGDDDCPVDLAERIRAAAGHLPVLVVVAVREFESIFLAGGESLYREGKLTGLPQVGTTPEAVRDAKGRVTAVIAAPCYQETTHQVKLASVVSLAEARACAWFTKLERDLRRVLGGA